LFATAPDADQHDALLGVVGLENLMRDARDDALDLLRRHQRPLAQRFERAPHPRSSAWRAASDESTRSRSLW
jgi:hypothetical protein